MAFESTDCNAVLQVPLKNLAAAIQESGAVIEHAQLPVLMADSSQLVQVFQNLIGSAIKFRESQSPFIRVSAELRGKEWRITYKRRLALMPNPSVKAFLRLGVNQQQHLGMLGTAILSALTEINSGLLRVDPHAVWVVGNQISLPRQPRNPKTVVSIGR